jgi:hypothetical protein
MDLIKELEEIKDQLNTNKRVDWNEADAKDEFFELSLRMISLLQQLENGHTRSEAGKELLRKSGYVTTCMWTRDDIVLHSIQQGFGKLYDVQVDEIIGLMGRRHDCSNGVNWDFIEEIIREVVQ